MRYSSNITRPLTRFDQSCIFPILCDVLAGSGHTVLLGTQQLYRSILFIPVLRKCQEILGISKSWTLDLQFRTLHTSFGHHNISTRRYDTTPRGRQEPLAMGN